MQSYAMNNPLRPSASWLAAIVGILLASVLLASCGAGGRQRYVIGVSQCSEDTWREKLNNELRVAALYYNNVELRISSANDDVRLQTRQIDNFVQQGVDLLIVAPGQVSISPAIDRAYAKGIPVIIFDRRTRSDKYTAYIGADNVEIGASMGEYLAAAHPRGARILELCGLPSSSPAIERSRGFDSVAASHPELRIVQRLHADWTEQGAYRVVDSLLAARYAAFDCVFAHNDRMAMGARKAAARHGIDIGKMQFCGIDAMPQAGGGMQLVRDGVLMASYIYPTRGDEVMRLAVNILTGRGYKRENRLSAALVTRDNARVLLMQNEETERQQEHLSALRKRVDDTASDFNTQRIYLLVLLVGVVILMVACAYAVNAYLTKARINRQLNDAVRRQRQLTQDMERMTQTQLQFFTNVSHELRTPLTLIAGPTSQLLAEPSVRPQYRNLLLMVQRNAQILSQLVGEILDFRKVQNGKAVLCPSRFCLYEHLNAWAADFRAAASRCNIGIVVEAAAEDSAAEIVADYDKLEHIYFNLMSNALKYTPDGGRITTRLCHAKGMFTVSVSDTGKGISADALPHLFERFYQAPSAVGGTGIGLSLVKAYVDMHGGTVRAESKPGEGATFVVSLPESQDVCRLGGEAAEPKHHAWVVADDGCARGAGVDASVGTQGIMGDEDFDADRPLVLVVDDNSDMRAYLRSILTEKYNVEEAADGLGGLERARRDVPKLIVSDVMMPVMDGLELTRRIKEDTATSHIPVILLTARSLPEQQGEGYDTGADSYITKPFTGKVLISRIDNLLRSRVLLKSIFSGGTDEAEAEAGLCATDRTFVQRLRDTIRANMADSSFSVERLGAEIGLSRVQLYRKVKAVTGQTPVELLRKARLERSRRLVERTEKSMAEIAYEVGFTSPSYFTKCFKDEFGVSPGSLRG